MKLPTVNVWDPPVIGNLRTFSINGVGWYEALLTQTDTDAPVATVLANNLGGDVVWSYVTTGGYAATLAGAFAEGKTAVMVMPNFADGPVHIQAGRTDDDTVSLSTVGLTTGEAADGLLTGAYIRIWVFP
jgi:hypothetical protein